LPLEDALKVETEGFLPLVGRHDFAQLDRRLLHDTAAAKRYRVANPAVQPLKVERVGVIGAGLMGAVSPMLTRAAGFLFMMLDSAPGALEKGLMNIGKVLQGRLGAGRLTQMELDATLARLSTTETLAAMGDHDLVVEAIVENEEVKKALFGQLKPI